MRVLFARDGGREEDGRGEEATAYAGAGDPEVARGGTDPGEIAEITAPLKAPGYDCSSIAYFKMVDADGFLSFPDDHQLGLDVLVRVERNTAGSQGSSALRQDA